MENKEQIFDNNNENTDVKICKKCGGQMRSNSKSKYCANCRNEMNAKIKKGLTAMVSGIGMLAITIIRKKK